ncbi:MAG: 2,3-bisphosphoglycerate-independent phosphoglycerate mutase [Candidatus Dichloromethanomonas elyunquensis]|nr:MAG: 2,3-bisphosphoglycerate-independent phosphoglycerate mutase [Candidatus Dichloromethanomonas elyunquensis]
MHFTMIFADGLGMGTNRDNPFIEANTPNLDRLLGGHFLWGEREIQHNNCHLYSVDALMGVRGIPQSATGQTALWTGINAAKHLGYHLNAYPNEKLMEIIKDHSIFKQLADLGKKATFANAFTRHYEQMIEEGSRRHSASTLCAQAGGVRLKRREDLLEGKAIYQDITNEIFRKKGEDVPLIQPWEAGGNLAKMSLEHDFVLFEYFQTDIRGHKRNMQGAIAVIETLDEFLGGYLSRAESISAHEPMAFILTSDHGNMEDLAMSTHTCNKVPALCWSNFEFGWPAFNSILDITPFIVHLFSKE